MTMALGADDCDLDEVRVKQEVVCKEEKMDDMQPCVKRARFEEGRGDGDDDDSMLADLTQMKPVVAAGGAAASAGGAAEGVMKQEGERKERFAVVTRSANTVTDEVPKIWMNRQTPLFQAARHGFVDERDLFTGIDFAFSGIPRTGAARQRPKLNLLGNVKPGLDVGLLEEAVVAHGGRVLPNNDLSSSLHPTTYIAELWGYIPSCVLIASTPVRTQKFVVSFR